MDTGGYLMETILGIVCLLIGIAGVIMQGISVINWPLAQKLHFQETDTNPLYSRLEKHTAMWDMFVLWTNVAVGILLLMKHPWWPIFGLVAGGVHIDTAGREVAKLLGLRREGVKGLSDKEWQATVGMFGIMAVVGLWTILVSAFALG